MADPMTPDQQAAFQELLIEVAGGAKAIRYFNLASWLFCTYDWILNLDREVELIWKRKFTSMTYFYLFNRYISGIFLTVSMFTYVQEYYIGDIFCGQLFLGSAKNGYVTLIFIGREWWKYEAFTCTICFQLVELVLYVAFELSRGRKFMLGVTVLGSTCLRAMEEVIGIIVGIFFTLEVLGMLTIIGIYFTHNFTATDTPFREYGIEDFHICVPTTNTSYVYSFWFPALAYGTLIAALAGWRGIQRYKDTRGSIGRSNGNWLLDIFIRDSLIYYILLALLELGVSVLWYSGPTVLIQLLIGVGMATPIVLCSKLILNLRGAYYEYNEDTARINLAMGPTAVGSSEAVKMGTFDGTPRPKVGQVSSRDMKRPVVAHSFSRGTTTFNHNDEWAAKHSDQSSGYR